MSSDATDNTMRVTCTDCGAQLTADEVEYYGSTCNTCEGKAYHQNENAEMADAPADLAARHAAKWSKPDREPSEDGMPYG